MTAPHHAYPMVPDQGGPKLAHLHLVTVLQAGDSQAAKLQSYGDWIVGSPWLTAVGAEYGVGSGTHELITLPGPAPTDVSSATIPDDIAASIAALELPATTPDTLYMMVYPQGATIDGTACPPQSPFGLGYHGEADSAAGHLTYAVVQSCSNQIPAQLENVISHELIEAATDARPMTQPGFQLALDDPWTNILGAEVGDLCSLSTIVDGSNTATRSYSNAAAALGHSPCVPAPSSPHFNVDVPGDAIHSAPPGGSIDIPIVGWSTAPVGDWPIVAYPGGYSVVMANLTLSQDTINNGQTATLTVQIPSSAHHGDVANIAIYSGVPSVESFWPVAVHVE